jgi:hypothetical protein
MLSRSIFIIFYNDKSSGYNVLLKLVRYDYSSLLFSAYILFT